MVFVEGGVAATGELTISFNDVDPPLAQEVPWNVPPPTDEVGGTEGAEEGADTACCVGQEKKRGPITHTRLYPWLTYERIHFSAFAVW